MTMFSSRPRFSDDPTPFVHPSGYRRSMYSMCVEPGPETYAPRPEFDLPQHHPTNWVLTEFRDALPTYVDKRLALRHYIEYVTDAEPLDERVHAVKVLTRLGRFWEPTPLASETGKETAR